MHKQDSSGIEIEAPLIVFAGRSNVGKSSVIRALTGKKVRVGKRPGSTTWEIEVDMGPVKFLDIPGFGFMAGRSKTEIEEMKTIIVERLEQWSERMVIAVLIVDISLFKELVERWENRNEIPIDIEFYSFLSEISSNVIVVANKSDKIKKRDVSTTMDYLRKKLKEAVPRQPLNIVATSATKKIGIDILKAEIEKILKKEGIGRPKW